MGVVGDFEPGRMLRLIEEGLGGSWGDSSGSSNQGGELQGSTLVRSATPVNGSGTALTSAAAALPPSPERPSLPPVAMRSPLLPSALIPVPYEQEPAWWGLRGGSGEESPDAGGHLRLGMAEEGQGASGSVSVDHGESPAGKIFIIDKPGSTQVGNEC